MTLDTRPPWAVTLKQDASFHPNAPCSHLFFGYLYPALATPRPFGYWLPAVVGTNPDFCPRFVRPLPRYFAPLFLSGSLVVRSVKRGPFVAVVLVLSPVARGHTYPVRFLSRALRFVPYGRTYIPNGAVSGPVVLSWISSGRLCLWQSLCELFQSIEPD